MRMQPDFENAYFFKKDIVKICILNRVVPHYNRDIWGDPGAALLCIRLGFPSGSQRKGQSHYEPKELEKGLNSGWVPFGYPKGGSKSLRAEGTGGGAK